MHQLILFTVAALTGAIVLVVAAFMPVTRYYERLNTRLFNAASVELVSQLHHAQRQWEEWENKAKSYQGLNSSILVDRDQWQLHHQTQSVYAANAQVLMMEQIARLHQLLLKHQIPVEIPTILQEVMAEHDEKWAKPAIEATGTKTIQRGPHP